MELKLLLTDPLMDLTNLDEKELKIFYLRKPIQAASRTSSYLVLTEPTLGPRL